MFIPKSEVEFVKSLIKQGFRDYYVIAKYAMIFKITEGEAFKRFGFMLTSGLIYL